MLRPSSEKMESNHPSESGTESPVERIDRYIASFESYPKQTDLDQRLEEMHPSKRIGFLESAYIKALKEGTPNKMLETISLLSRWQERMPDRDFTPHIKKLAQSVEKIENFLRRLADFEEASRTPSFEDTLKSIRAGLLDRLHEVKDVFGNPII